MRVRLLKYWDRLQASFWFVPGIMAVGAVALVFTTVYMDEALMRQGWEKDWSFVYTGGAEGASSVLGTIAGSMMTIAGVVFSMTLVALTLASSQFGPRLLRNFMSDTSNQVVLGTFVATFLYCVLVLRTIRYSGENGFVPHLSVTLGVLFALASMGVLIYFIHHVSVSIQADEIIRRVSAELAQGIDRMFPEEAEARESEEEPGSTADAPRFPDREARPATASGDGYLQFVDIDALVRLGAREDLVIQLVKRPGHYIFGDSILALVWPAHSFDTKLEAEVNAAMILGHQRTPTQDIEFAIHQLVEIAVRALSPGVNDPYTAIRCVDRLGSALCRLARRHAPTPFHRDKENRIRVIETPVTFPAIVDAAFDQIRQNARSTAAVTIRLLETIAVIAACVHRKEDRSALRRQADIIARGAQEGLAEAEDRRDVQERLQEVIAALRDLEGTMDPGRP